MLMKQADNDNGYSVGCSLKLVSNGSERWETRIPRDSDVV